MYVGYSEAKNKFLNSFNANKLTSNIIQPNNLYIHSMLQLLPTEIFDWVDDSPRDCFLDVDLDYPDELHDWGDDSQKKCCLTINYKS